ncbi:MAG: hypothetical protein ACK5KP_07290 [Paludibacteraceae bacterium]
MKKVVPPFSAMPREKAFLGFTPTDGEPVGVKKTCSHTLFTRCFTAVSPIIVIQPNKLM